MLIPLSLYFLFQEAKPYKNDPEILAMTNLVAAYQKHDINDFERILNNYEWSFVTAPRYRQRIAKVPFLDHPVWVDDPSFNARYHIRQIALPQPADERVLKRVCGYLLELPLDMKKPPWEAWIVDGLPGDQFAIITKIHHCMADGISGLSLIQTLLGVQPFERKGTPIGRLAITQEFLSPDLGRSNDDVVTVAQSFGVEML